MLQRLVDRAESLLVVGSCMRISSSVCRALRCWGVGLDGVEVWGQAERPGTEGAPGNRRLAVPGAD